MAVLEVIRDAKFFDGGKSLTSRRNIFSSQTIVLSCANSSASRSSGIRGWKVCEAVDGAEAEAVRKSQQLAPDAVVLDLRMPEMDGLAAGRRLRQLMPKLPMALIQPRYKFAP
jgi:CheY-like chemotaxis protein